MLRNTDRSDEKTADYWIMDVEHEGPGRRGPIVALALRPLRGGELGALTWMTLVEVLALMVAGKTFCTAKDGKFGAWVTPFVRSKPDGDPDNNLD
jgi:hypothetical protein